MLADLAPGLLNNLLATAAISFGVQIVLWLICMKTEDATPADWWWGLGYATIALYTWFNTAGVGLESRRLLITACTVIWGVRLSLHLILRSYADRWRELDRYEKYRVDAAKAGMNVNWYIYRKVFGTQGPMMWIVSLPVQVAQFYLRPTELGAIAIVGAVLWTVGFVIEASCDFQLARFKAAPANKGNVLDHGLWYFSRLPHRLRQLDRPVDDRLAAAHALPHGLPLGIGWLEEKMSNQRPQYRDYIARTNRFYPWLPKHHSDRHAPRGEAD